MASENFPVEKELREILDRWGRNLEYVEFAALKRGMVTYDTI